MAGDDRLRHRNLRNHESTRVQKMPRALRDAIAADAIFGALLLVRALLCNYCCPGVALICLHATTMFFPHFVGDARQPESH
jgi:hypothetical protein